MALNPTHEELARRTRELEQRLSEKELILDSLVELVVYQDTEMKILWANRAACDSMRLPREALQGSRCYQIWGNRERPCESCPIERALKTGKPQQNDVSTPDGRTWFVQGYPVHDADNIIVGAVELVLETTRQKRAEEELRKYESITATSNDHMALIDSNYILQAVNESLLKAYNKNRADIIGQPVKNLVGDELFNSEYKAHCDRCLSGEEVNHRLWVDYPASGRRYMDIAGYPFRDATHKISGIVVNSRDITETRMLQDQLIHAKKMEAIGTLAGGIAHDFNNLLMGIQGRTALMQMETDPSHPQYAEIQGIEECVKSASELTKQLLGFARGGKYQMTPTDLNDLIHQQTVMFCRTRKDLSVHTTYQPDLPTVEADQGQLKQVLLNLYLNASQAMPDGGDLFIRSQTVVLDQPSAKSLGILAGLYAMVTITDTGMGIPKQIRERIFEPFFSTRESGRGTGLGLASVYGIIENHGGRIRVSSREGQGTTFRFYLPVSGKQATKPITTSRSPQKGNETILIVDDEEMAVYVGRKLLEKIGYTVLTACNGREAIDLFSTNRNTINLVILDMIMPGMTGADTFDELKRLNPDVKVLLCSGYSIDGQAMEILKRGCKGFIQKPFDLNLLSFKMREVLDA